MRSLIAAFALISSPIALAAAEEETPAEPDTIALPAELPEKITPEVLGNIAQRLERLSRVHLVEFPGGRKTAEQRRTLAQQTERLARELTSAAQALDLAQTGSADISAQLAKAETAAMETTYRVASEVADLGVKQELFELLDTPPPALPEPVTHVFCMEASGAAPNTFRRYAIESLTASIPYVQGYITHELEQTAQTKLRLALTVEHDADSAPFAAIDALQAANKAAVAEMNNPQRRAAETILMGEFAERLCSPT